MSALLVDSDSDTENQPLMTKRELKTMSRDSSSSDSDADPSPPKQRKTVRSVRGLAKLLSQKSDGFTAVSANDPDLKPSDMYSSAASECMKAAENIKLPMAELTEKLDIEEDAEANRRKGKVASRKPRGPKQPTLIDFGDEEEEEEDCQAEFLQNRDRSPTPPPTLNLPTKNKRKMKGVVQAIKKLDSVTARFNQEQEDDDVCIIDVVSPTSLQRQQDEKKQTVKVRTRQGIMRFLMKRTDDFSTVFRAVAAAEGVSEQRVSLCRGDDASDTDTATPAVQPYDTPACVALRVTDILDAYIRRGGEGEGDGGVSREACAEDDPDAVALRVQGKDPKSRCSITVNKHEPLERMMRRYASIVAVPYQSLTFNFDGDALDPARSAEDMDLEDDFCIDVVGI